MQRLTEHTCFVGCHTVAWVTVLVGLLGCASSAHPVLLGRVPTLSCARYRVTLEMPQMIFQGQDTAMVVRVQNEQGLPVEGLHVVFQVDPAWAKYTSVRPARAHTQGGKVRAIVRTDLVGLVRIAVRVGAVTKWMTIRVMIPLAMGYTVRMQDAAHT